MFCLYIFSLCMIHHGALSGSLRSSPPHPARGAAARLPLRGSARLCAGLPSPRTNTSPQHVREKIGTPYLHSPGNSAKLGTSTAPRTAGAAAATAAAAAAAGGSGAAGTDRSTGRVVVAVPFSGCAAPSLHPCRRCGVVERSAAIEEGERRQWRRRRRRRGLRKRRVQRLPLQLSIRCAQGRFLEMVTLQKVPELTRVVGKRVT